MTGAKGTNGKMIGIVCNAVGSSYMISRDLSFFSDTTARRLIVNFERKTESLYESKVGGQATQINYLTDQNATGSYDRKIKVVGINISDTGSTITEGTFKIYGRKRL